MSSTIFYNSQSLVGIGNVGIGTTNPSYALDVNGFIRTIYPLILDTTATGSNYSAFRITAGGDGQCYIQAGSSLTSAATANVLFTGINGGPERMRINLTSGNVGIGTTSPTFKLQIAGDVGPNATNSYNLGAAGSNWGCLYYNGGTQGTCASDERLKANISDIDFGSDPLAQIANLRPRTFSFLSDENSNMYNGLIAQEVEQFSPELVVTNQDGYKAIKYGDIQWLTLEAVKQLNLEVKELSSLDITSESSLGSLIKNFLADEIISIKEFTSGLLHINGDVCVDDVCVTKEEFKQMLINAKNGAGGGEATTVVDTIIDTNPSANDGTDVTTVEKGTEVEGPSTTNTDTTTEASPDAPLSQTVSTGNEVPVETVTPTENPL